MPRTAAAPAPAPGRSRLPSLTGLRTAAALMVFGFHIYAVALFASPTANSWMSHSLSQGGVGVTFFFLLSGFLLTWTARANDTVRGFWRRRAAKIVPNHLVTWVVALAFLGWTGLTLTGSFTPVGLDSLPNLLLLQDWIPRGGVFFSMNIPSWSLGCEAFFYLCFPLLLPLLRRIPVRGLWPAALALAAAVWAMPALAQLLFHQGPNVPGLPVSEDRMWFVYTFPPVRMLEFALGMVLALIVAAGRWPALRLRTATVLAVLGYLASSWLPYLYGLNAGALIPLALLIPTAATADLENRASVWRGRVLCWLGNVSFAFYLVHQLVIRWVHYLFGATRSFATPEALGLTVLSLLLALGLATVLYYAVEMPLMRRLSHGRPRTVSPVPLGLIPAQRAGSAVPTVPSHREVQEETIPSHREVQGEDEEDHVRSH
ncbi:acyltransferase [Kitasatospora sp. NBC_01287]|uniref:acyltransferase family protein n=1 Tax=Kitasatospora sp. NBC_01287 TaxID=2903573 RepID=UPI0022539A0D|nr:acyltransferase [Kitasatospora sp. NBC_01287]MCX4747735.1 acyltransferase [Kitasatospora sp. NBC_01287]